MKKIHWLRNAAVCALVVLAMQGLRLPASNLSAHEEKPGCVVHTALRDIQEDYD